MKKYLSIGTAALLAGGMFALAACSSDDAATQEVVEISQVPLEVQVGGVQASTRGIIEGTTLPTTVEEYGVFALYGNNWEQPLDNGCNARVWYSNGTSRLEKTILLPQGVDVPVYAYYPYKESYNSVEYLMYMPIEVESQTDYLCGHSVDGDNQWLYANPDRPKVDICFKHVLARVTLNIKKAEDNTNSYKLSTVSLNNVYSESLMSLLKEAVVESWGRTNINITPASYVLSDQGDVVTADFLVIPEQQPEVSLTLDAGSYQLSAMIPATGWESGKQYIYEVTIGKGGKLAISEATITPWDNNPQEGIEVGDNNYVEN